MHFIIRRKETNKFAFHIIHAVKISCIHFLSKTKSIFILRPSPMEWSSISLLFISMTLSDGIVIDLLFIYINGALSNEMTIDILFLSY